MLQNAVTDILIRKLYNFGHERISWESLEYIREYTSDKAPIRKLLYYVACRCDGRCGLPGSTDAPDDFGRVIERLLHYRGDYVAWYMKGPHQVCTFFVHEGEKECCWNSWCKNSKME